jgi:uncharacterized membrane protein
MVLLLGSIFILLSVLHTNIWFDEAYSVKMAENSFVDIWKIGSHDVHPIFYYFLLHIVFLIFGKSIIAYRIFSALCIIGVGIIGYTLIRKDFGEKVGLYYSILALFLPFAATYSSEIRMYTLGLLIGSIFSVYAYRIYNNKEFVLKDYIIFGISSILLCYTHYYGLVFAGVLNFILLVYLIVKRKTKKKEIETFSIIAIIQIVLYLPWLMVFLSQLNSVSHGFWISLSFPNTLFEVLSTQFRGNLSLIFGLVYSLIILVYLFYRLVVMIKNRKEEKDSYKPALLSFILYVAITLLVYIVSVVMQPILVYRYLLVISSLMIFAISYVLGKDNSKIVPFLIIIGVFIISIINYYYLIKENYDKSNYEAIMYVEENIRDGDIILYRNAINGCVITSEISMEKDNISYFYDKDHWNVDEAYKAFGSSLMIKQELADILDDYSGRIFIIDSGNSSELYNEINGLYLIDTIDHREFKQKYKSYTYSIYMVEK